MTSFSASQNNPTSQFLTRGRNPEGLPEDVQDFEDVQFTVVQPQADTIQDLFEQFNSVEPPILLEATGQMTGPKENGNGSSPKEILTTSNLKQATVALVAVKQEMEKTGSLESPEMREKFQDIVQLIQDVHEGFNTQVSVQLKAVRQKAMAIAQEMRQTADLNTLLQLIVTQVQETLKADRVLIYRFDTPDQGTVLQEALVPGWTPTLGETLPVVSFGWDAIAHKQGQTAAINNVSRATLSPYQLQLLEKFQVKASLALPIAIHDQVWGLLVVQHCARPQLWQETDITLLSQISTELTSCLQIDELDRQLQRRTEQNNALVRITNKIYQARDLASVFQVTTQEVRMLLGCDRVVIYRFNPDWSGEFVAESVGGGWTSLVQVQKDDPSLRENINECSVKTLAGGNDEVADTYLQQTKGGKYSQGQVFRASTDIYDSGFSACYIRILEQYQARAYVTVALYQGQSLWGLLAAYQNSGPRQWKPTEIDLLVQLSTQLGIALRQASYVEQMQNQSQQLATLAQQEQAVAKVVSKIRAPLNVPAIFETAVSEIRSLLKGDRTAIYRFNPDWSGRFVAESVGADWTSLLEEQVRNPFLNENASDCSMRMLRGDYSRSNDDYMRETRGGQTQSRKSFVENDLLNSGLAECYIELLQRYQARAYIIIPIYQDQKVWGMLAVYQNSGPRLWEANEVKVLEQIARQLGTALQRAESAQQLAKTAKREQSLNRVIAKIRQSSDIETIFTATTQELRKLFSIERVTIYKFRSDYFGDFVTESVSKELPDLVGSAWEDPYLNEHQGGRFRNNIPLVVDDVYTGETVWENGQLNLQKPKVLLTDCHVEALEGFGVKSCAVASIFQGQHLWGLLSVFQNSGPRHWEEDEVKLLMQIANQLGIVLQQTEYLEQLQAQSRRVANLADLGVASMRLIHRLECRIIEMSKEGSSAEYILRLATQELRKQLKADRVAIYRFRANWGGEFTVEDVGPQWVKLVGSEELAVLEDTHLQETQGGRYRRNESFRVNDIYTIGHADCHVALLERLQAKAYMISPIFKGEQLWGLLGAYQNSGPRHWEDLEEVLLSQVGAEIGVALQQAEYIEKVQIQSQQIAEAAQREKAAKEQLQREVIQLLSSVRPVLEGDLTIRVPVTENEVGTVADAYNNTIQSLRTIVMQVQAAADKVGQTSQNSGVAIAHLSQQSQQEVQELTEALKQVQSMVNAAQTVAENARQVGVAVQQANQIVQQGDTAMNRTVEGIQAVRTTVSETSKKIKRLSESSQKISKVVNLINSFTNQTQLLALNAAIEATRAGEFGRGFAVVADEVRSLAQQSAEATVEIEKLVQEIQSETTAVSTAMDTGIEQVVGGTALVNETRQSLTAIVTATAQITQLVQGITQSTQAQTQQSESVTQTMTQVVAIANKTSTESAQISSSFQQLLATAEELQISIRQFKVS